MASLKVAKAAKQRYFSSISARVSSLGSDSSAAATACQHQLIATQLRDPLMTSSNAANSFTDRQRASALSNQFLLQGSEQQLVDQSAQVDIPVSTLSSSGQFLPQGSGQNLFLGRFAQVDGAATGGQPLFDSLLFQRFQAEARASNELSRHNFAQAPLLLEQLLLQRDRAALNISLHYLLPNTAPSTVQESQTTRFPLGQLRRHLVTPSLATSSHLGHEAGRAADATIMAELINATSLPIFTRQGTGNVVSLRTPMTPLLFRHESGSSISAVRSAMPTTLFQREHGNALSTTTPGVSTGLRSTRMQGSVATASHSASSQLMGPATKATLDRGIRPRLA